MQNNISGAGARLILLFSMIVLSGCALPRPGPNAEEIVAASKRAGGNLNIVLVDQQIARRAYVSPNLGFSTEFLTLPGTRTDIINPGDTLSITVWENVNNGLLVGAGQKVAKLDQIQVDQRGRIFMPYAGRLDAAGMTPDELREVITDRLGSQTPDPQVEVRREAGDGATVNIIGGVAQQGVFPVEPSTDRLAAMLATAGGVTVDPEIAIVTVRRRGRSGSIFLQDLFDNPALDISLRAGDTVIVEIDRRAFTASTACSSVRGITRSRSAFPARSIIPMCSRLFPTRGRPPSRRWAPRAHRRACHSRAAT